jgi:SAM-dependent methyltransferase
LFVPTAPTSATLHDLYDHYYERARFTTPATVIASLEVLVGSAERFRKTGRWLDIGYGEGSLLTVAERHGWACHGSEVSPHALEYGRQRAWAVTSDPGGDVRFQDAAFDVVTMIELLEHVQEPTRFLAHAAQWLRPGGLLYITTPNAGSLNCRVLGLSWSTVSPPEHLVLWTVGALRRALAPAGFVPFRVRTEGCNPSEILVRLRPSRSRAGPVDRNQTALALSEAFSRTRLRRAMKAVLNSGLSASRLGDTIKVWAVRAS